MILDSKNDSIGAGNFWDMSSRGAADNSAMFVLPPPGIQVKTTCFVQTWDSFSLKIVDDFCFKYHLKVYKRGHKSLED